MYGRPDPIGVGRQRAMRQAGGTVQGLAENQMTTMASITGPPKGKKHVCPKAITARSIQRRGIVAASITMGLAAIPRLAMQIGFIRTVAAVGTGCRHDAADRHACKPCRARYR